MSGPMLTCDALIAELRDKARNAAMRNKPMMWAYYLDCADGLTAYFEDVDRTDIAYAGAALALSDSSRTACANLQPIESARLWARGVYARRILAAWGAGIGLRASLAWLRERAMDPR